MRACCEEAETHRAWEVPLAWACTHAPTGTPRTTCTGAQAKTTHPHRTTPSSTHSHASFHVPKRKRGLIGAALGPALNHRRDPSLPETTLFSSGASSLSGKRHQRREN